MKKARRRYLNEPKEFWRSGTPTQNHKLLLKITEFRSKNEFADYFLLMLLDIFIPEFGKTKRNQAKPAA